jgi:TonB family protein
MHKLIIMMFLKLAIGILFLSCIAAHAQEPKLKEGELSTFFKANTIYPAYALHNCIQGIVKVDFKINKVGRIYDAVVAQGVGADLDNEALRLVKMTSGKWAIPDAYDTAVVVTVPVNFALSGYGCDQASKADIALAIRAYKNQEELFNVVTNFYKNKEKGNFKAEDETSIVAIKADLGVDEEYLQERINLGLKKYKQGDREGACEEFNFVKYMGSAIADELLVKYCK